MAAIGFATMAVTASMRGIQNEIRKNFAAPLQKASKQAGADISAGIATGVRKAELDVKKATQGIEAATKKVAEAEHGVAQAKSAVLAATKTQEAAELELERVRVVSGAKTREAEQALEHARKSGKATASELEKLENRLNDARLKGESDVAKKEAALEKARQAVASKTRGVEVAEDSLRAAKNKAEESTERLTAAEKRLADATDGVRDDVRGLDADVDSLGGKFEGLTGKLGGFAGGLTGIAGVGAFAAMGLEVDNAVAQMNNQLGYTGESAQRAADAVNTALRSGVTGSAADAAAAVGAIESQFDMLGVRGEQTAGELADNFLGFAQTFDVGVEEATQTAGQLLVNGLATNVEEAADLMTAAMQRVPAQMRDELPEIINEYGTNFRALGFSGEEAFSMLVTASEKGKWALDKTGDALKEFTIRGSDMSATSVEAYQALGLNAEQMSNAIASGGAGAQQALQEVATSLLAMEDPADRANTAIALFGTPLEDLSVDQIPQFLDALSQGTGAMNGFEGASQAIADNLSNSLQGRLDTLKGTVLSLAGDGFMALWDAGESVAQWARDNQTWLAPLTAGLGTLAGIVGIAAGAQTAWTTALGVYTAAQGLATGALALFNTTLLANPIMLVVAAVAALVAGLVVFFTKTETGRRIWDKFTGALKSGWETFVSVIKTGADKITGFIGGIVDKFKAIPGKIKEVFRNAGQWLVNAGRDLMDGFARGLRSAPGAIGNAIKAMIPDALERFLPFADGGLLAFANGGMLGRKRDESHVAQIAPAGAWRVWAEPETGGEAYIPLAQGKRARSTRILATVADTFGLALTGKDGQRIPPSAAEFVQPTGVQHFADGGITARKLLDFAAGKPVDGKQAPRSLEGAPYVWGGGLLSNWGDCSGAMSGLAAFVAGVSLAGRKFATMSQGAWLGSNGFKRGTSGGRNAFEIGYFNGGPYGGHTSGTIYDGSGNATNVEMGGGRGNGQIGGRAAGARHSQYTDRFWAPLATAEAGAIAAGSVVSTSTQGVEVAAPAWSSSVKQIDWGTASSLYEEHKKTRARAEKLSLWNAGVYDTGGVLKPNTAAVNLSGKPEIVINNRQLGAFARLSDNLGKLIPALQALATQPNRWGAVGSELWSTVRTGTWTGTTLAKDNPLVSTAVAMNDAFGNTLMALTESTAEEWSALAKRVGLDELSGFADPLIKANAGLEDARIAQVDANAALVQAEENLKLAREDAAKITDKNSDDAKLAAEKIVEAENELAAARGVVQLAAKATGRAEIEMVLSVADAVVSLVNKVIGMWNAAQAGFARGISESMGHIRDWVELVDAQRATVAKLQQQQITQQIALTHAAWDTRLAQADQVRAQLEGAKTVAAAEAALQAERDKQARRNAQGWKDLSLEYDRYRFNEMQGLSDRLGMQAAVTPEILALEHEVNAAKLNAAAGQLNAQLTALEAMFKQQEAAAALMQTQRELARQSELLASMQANAFGLSTEEAIYGASTAKLQEEIIRLEGQRDSKWWSISYNLMGGRAADQQRIDQLRAQLAEREAAGKTGGIAIDRATADRAKWLFAIGQTDAANNLLKSTRLGDAERALQDTREEREVLAARAERDELAESIAAMQKRLAFETQAQTLREKIAAYEAGAAANTYSADALREENPAVRSALETLAAFERSNATQYAAGARGEATVINLTVPEQDLYTREQFDALVGVVQQIPEIDARVARIEAPKRATASQVMAFTRSV